MARETPAAPDTADAPAGPVEPGAAGAGPEPACAVPSVRDLLVACAAARTVSTPPSCDEDEERRAAPEHPERRTA
ncbi:hypothetical protein [Actinacidiphila sp. bgisy144]|uniref:hypothetical protein n=1 Tax=unclassified Actinacidiphila TaxID=2995708 RepID=UPI003EBF6081